MKATRTKHKKKKTPNTMPMRTRMRRTPMGMRTRRCLKCFPFLGSCGRPYRAGATRTPSVSCSNSLRRRSKPSTGTDTGMGMKRMRMPRMGSGCSCCARCTSSPVTSGRCASWKASSNTRTRRTPTATMKKNGRKRKRNANTNTMRQQQTSSRKTNSDGSHRTDVGKWAELPSQFTRTSPSGHWRMVQWALRGFLSRPHTHCDGHEHVYTDALYSLVSFRFVLLSKEKRKLALIQL
mmetsp:Transcript_926/g.2142  ORF Transcript_926/g.2142 Transcript_926/m.2142 type:complete len:236 (+) Transcript_926:630-1337(+)